MTYSEFINQFEIYPSQYKARAKGFEAHHIVPVALQKDNETFDDRCVRLTPFEHIYAHYLLALENKDAVVMFFCIFHLREFKLSDLEKITLEELEHWATLREKAVEKISKALKGKPLPEETKKKQSETMKGHPTSEETKKKMSEAHKGKTLSEETRKRMSEARKAYFSVPENKQHQSEAQRARWSDPEVRKRAGEANKGRNHSEETKKKRSEALRAYYSVPENRQKASDSRKGKPIKPHSEEHRARLSEIQRQLSEEYHKNNLGLSWNEFQKYYREQNKNLYIASKLY